MSGQPDLEVIRGNPTPTELAALVAVLAAVAAGSDEPESAPALSGWGSPAGTLRTAMPTNGPGAWLATSRQR
jgi:hypothetical protein